MDTDDEYDELLYSPNPDNPFWQVSLSTAKPLTRADFDSAVDFIYRDHGIFGRHSQECIYLTDENHRTHWLCAPDCGIANRFRDRESSTDPGEDHSWTDGED